jgi:hypothetical protein
MSVFLPRAIYTWGGIECWLNGDRSRMCLSGNKYPLWYDASGPRTIILWVLRRLAKSGKVTVTQANDIIWKICQKYSGAPNRSYDAAKIDGFGYLVIDENDHINASFQDYKVRMAARLATQNAMDEGLPHSDIESRLIWRAGGTKYEELKPCRWCQTPVLVNPKWKKSYNGTVRCNSRDCRRIEYLQHVPQSRGGIDLTPTQRKATEYAAQDTQKVINYLVLITKETKRANRANHDLRRCAANHH